MSTLQVIIIQTQAHQYGPDGAVLMKCEPSRTGCREYQAMKNSIAYA